MKHLLLLASILVTACGGADFSTAPPDGAGGDESDSAPIATGGASTGGSAGSAGQAGAVIGGARATGGNAGQGPGGTQATGGSSGTGGVTNDAGTGGAAPNTGGTDSGTVPDCLHELCCNNVLCPECPASTGGGCCIEGPGSERRCGCLVMIQGPAFVCQ